MDATVQVQRDGTMVMLSCWHVGKSLDQELGVMLIEVQCGLRGRVLGDDSSYIRKLPLGLQQQPMIESVYYPGLNSHPQNQLAATQMTQPGGMIAFELKQGLDAGIRFMDSLQMIKRAVSLGDAETLCQHPASMTHATYPPEERFAHGISEGLIRMSVGLENIADILQDIDAALDAAMASRAAAE